MTWKEFKDYVDGEIKRLGMDEDVDILVIDTVFSPELPLHCWIDEDEWQDGTHKQLVIE